MMRVPGNSRVLNTPFWLFLFNYLITKYSSKQPLQTSVIQQNMLPFQLFRLLGVEKIHVHESIEEKCIDSKGL